MDITLSLALIPRLPVCLRWSVSRSQLHLLQDSLRILRTEPKKLRLCWNSVDYCHLVIVVVGNIDNMTCFIMNIALLIQEPLLLI